MINIKDLRIGNNVLCDGVISTVYGILKYGLILEEDYEEGEEFVYEPINRIEGIKLTLELLKREGATCKSYGYGDKEWYQCNIQGCTLNQSGDKFTYDGNEIEFLHELQNKFYFDSEKEELTVDL
jgi:hypothetical protein